MLTSPTSKVRKITLINFALISLSLSLQKVVDREMDSPKFLRILCRIGAFDRLPLKRRKQYVPILEELYKVNNCSVFLPNAKKLSLSVFPYV